MISLKKYGEYLVFICDYINSNGEIITIDQAEERFECVMDRMHDLVYLAAWDEAAKEIIPCSHINLDCFIIKRQNQQDQRDFKRKG